MFSPYIVTSFIVGALITALVIMPEFRVGVWQGIKETPSMMLADIKKIALLIWSYIKRISQRLGL